MTLIPKLFASAQNELTPPATSSNFLPIRSSDFNKKYRRYSSNVRPSNTTRSSCNPRLPCFKGGMIRGSERVSRMDSRRSQRQNANKQIKLCLFAVSAINLRA